jgi:hypothetical protein
MAQKPPTAEEQIAIETALRVVHSIAALLKNDDFQRFLTQHSERADQLAMEILHHEMKPKKREALRNRRLGVLEVLLSLREDRDAQAGLLARHGIAPGDVRE